ncbi:MAG: hypothetical protein MUO77_18545 [Anaerolineales bacterium]|nr:hypothetical protein [Anaerolineales bacterium]
MIITGIGLVVGMLHFVKGEDYQGSFPIFINSYLIDILLPMAMYLLMGLFQNKLAAHLSFVPVRCSASVASLKRPNIMGIPSLEAPLIRSILLLLWQDLRVLREAPFRAKNS